MEPSVRIAWSLLSLWSHLCEYLIVQAPFAPADHELFVDSVTPSAPVAPLNVTNNDARKAELQALVHVGYVSIVKVLICSGSHIIKINFIDAAPPPFPTHK